MKIWIVAFEVAAQNAAVLYAGAALVAAFFAAAVWVLLRLRPEWNAATRHVLWLTAFAAPVLWMSFAFIHPPRPADLRRTTAPAETVLVDPAEDEDAPKTLLAVAAVAVPAATAPTVPSGRLAFSFFAVTALIAWAIGSFVLLARLGQQLAALRRLKRNASALPAERADQWVPRREKSASRRRVQILSSDAVATPVAAGLGAPSVLIPRSFAAELGDADLTQIVRHELAHLHRGDDWTQLLQRLLEAVLWPLPTTRFLGARLDLTREMACDDWVLAETQAAKPYARCLAKVAALHLHSVAPVLAPGMAAGSKSQLFQRIEAILARRRQGASPLLPAGRVAAVCVGALVTTLVLSQAWAAAPSLELKPVSESLLAQNETNPDPGPTPNSAPRIAGEREAERELERGLREKARRLREEARGMSEAVREQVRQSLLDARDAMVEGVQGMPYSFGSDEPRPRALTPEVLALLTRSASEDADAEVREESIQSLARASSPEATDALLKIYDYAKDEPGRELVLGALARRQKGNAKVTAKFLELAKSPNASAKIREAAFRGLSRSADEQGIRALVEIYESNPPVPLKESIIRSLGRCAIKSKTASTKLAAIAKDDPDAKMRKRAIRELSRSDSEGDFSFSWPPVAPVAPVAPVSPVSPIAPIAPAAPVAPVAMFPPDVSAMPVAVPGPIARAACSPAPSHTGEKAGRVPASFSGYYPADGDGGNFRPASTSAVSFGSSVRKL